MLELKDEAGKKEADKIMDDVIEEAGDFHSDYSLPSVQMEQLGRIIKILRRSKTPIGILSLPPIILIFTLHRPSHNCNFD